jgi:hypothetical protein
MQSVEIDYDKFPQLRIFETHGVDFSGSRGDEFYGTCPFTGKDDKFYVNSKTWLWDSKTAGLSGNIASFLQEVGDEYKSNLTDGLRQQLSHHRKLPTTAFAPWEVGWTGTHISIPVRDVANKIVDIRLYDLKKHQMRSTAGCHVGLLGAHQLKSRLAEPVYVCEGEWDAMALAWLLKKTNTPGIVVGVPGAGIFKKEWIKWFTGRKVRALYDHDEPGRRGEQTLFARLNGQVKDLSFAHWPAELPDGFDVRDWIVHGIRKNAVEDCWVKLTKLFQSKPRRTGITQTTETGQTIRLIGKAKVEQERPEVVPTLADVHRIYQKWLHLPNTDAVDVMLATALSQRMDGPPVWLFLVSPPGGAKTITMEGLVAYDKSYSTSSLTAHALISGANWQGQTDPSLIPRLDGKVLLIKDFTTVLNLREDEKEQIFGILRDAYDGTCGKVFGNGVERTYKSRFTIIAGVTPKIYEIGARHAALGERFLKYSMGDNLAHHEEDKIISRAIDNVDHDQDMKDELMAAASPFLQFGFDDLETPALDSVLHNRIIKLAQFGARLRGNVSRDMYNGEMMTGRPFAEVGSRLGIQLAKLARALAVVRGKSAVDEDEYRLVKKVMLDTISQRSEDVVRTMYQYEMEVAASRNGHRHGLTAAEIAERTRYPMTTVRRLMDDLNLLNVIERNGSAGSGFKHTWTVSAYVTKTIQESGVYSDASTPPMPRRLIIKQKRRD